MSNPVALDARALCSLCMLHAINHLRVTVGALAAAGPGFEAELDGAWLTLSFDGTTPPNHTLTTYLNPCPNGACRT